MNLVHLVMFSFFGGASAAQAPVPALISDPARLWTEPARQTVWVASN